MVLHRSHAYTSLRVHNFLHVCSKDGVTSAIYLKMYPPYIFDFPGCENLIKPAWTCRTVHKPFVLDL